MSKLIGLLNNLSICQRRKGGYRGQQGGKNEAFNSIIQDLIQNKSKLNPKRWLTLCSAALGQEAITPPELSPSSFEYLKEFANNSTLFSLFSKEYSADFNQLLAIAYISDCGKNAFINQRFDHRGFKSWLSLIAIPNINLMKISTRDIEEITLNENNLISFSSNTDRGELNINDCQYVNKDFGTLFYSNGDKYIGQLHNGVPNGKGTILFASGALYKGEWRNGKRHGYGTLYYSNGDKYDGEWRNDKIEGFGIFTYSDGSRYEGNLRNDKKHGSGTFFYTNGDIYDGEWANGNKHGQGTYTFANGEKYIGNFENNKFAGYGNIYYKDGSHYRGEWKDNQRHGHGVYFYPDGTHYSGVWKDGAKHGYGISFYKSGNKFEGYWKNNMYHGPGLFTYDDGAQFLSWMQDNVIISGMYIFPDSINYSGTLLEIEQQILQDLIITNNDKLFDYFFKLYIDAHMSDSFVSALAECRNFYQILAANQCEFSQINPEADKDTVFTDSLTGEDFSADSKVVLVKTNETVHVLSMKFLLNQMVTFLDDWLRSEESNCKFRVNPYNRQEINLSNLLSPQSIGKYKRAKFIY